MSKPTYREVIKVVTEVNGKLYSTFASGSWCKEYKPGVTTVPNIGYLFAYPKSRLSMAKRETAKIDHYWIAEATVVGKVTFTEMGTAQRGWNCYWECFRLKHFRRSDEYDYLLCSSITLIREL